MQPDRIETDYFVVGAGAMGMAFADEILSERPEARITLVDRRARPGGHWVDAYPFVTLHQPAAFYGVNSASLGSGGEDLSTRAEILAYYERVLHRFQASGRVTFLPLCEYRGDGRVVSRVEDGRVTEIDVRERTVDASYMNVEVPATHPPRYEVDPDVALVPPNALARIEHPWEKYVVIGAGKTGIDAILFLLGAGVEPARIRWIVSQDMWLWNRALVQPGIATLDLLRHVRAIADSASVDEVFLRLEEQGSLFRIDPAVVPSKWRCATVDEAELRGLRRIEDVVRAGRVRHIRPDEIELDRKTLPTSARTLHVDCSANGLAAREPRPIFTAGRVTLQSISMCQQVFSAAVIARLTSMKLDDAERNAICQPVPHPESTRDMPACLLRSMQNVVKVGRSMPLWLRRSRLNVGAHDPLRRYLANGFRLRRLLPRAQASAARMLAG